jgi:hypothetical protein
MPVVPPTSAATRGGPLGSEAFPARAVMMFGMLNYVVIEDICSEEFELKGSYNCSKNLKDAVGLHILYFIHSQETHVENSATDTTTG